MINFGGVFKKANFICELFPTAGPRSLTVVWCFFSTKKPETCRFRNDWKICLEYWLVADLDVEWVTVPSIHRFSLVAAIFSGGTFPGASSGVSKRSWICWDGLTLVYRNMNVDRPIPQMTIGWIHPNNDKPYTHIFYISGSFTQRSSGVPLLWRVYTCWSSV